jgi:ABC-type branched-subunit amino acid transport system ATPase component
VFSKKDLSLLEIANIYKSFGKQQVLRGLSMTLEAGKIHTIIGGNGTGKTVLFNIITGFLEADKGEIRLNDKRIDNKGPVAINSKGITRTFQDLRIINQLTVKENILLSFKNNPGENILNSLLPAKVFKNQYSAFNQRAEEILETVYLKSVENNLAGEISCGQQKLLTIGCCLANGADLLLLDEPVAGIDKDNYQRIFKLIQQLKSEGKTIIQIEHNYTFIESLSDRLWFLFGGEAKSFENYKQFINDGIVKQNYLN